MKVLIGGAGTQCQYTTARNRRANQVCRERRQFIVSRAFTSLKTPNDDPATSGAAPFWPTRVRVQHDSYIRANRAAIWQLIQDVTPDHKWPALSVVLATLESIYGVEYQGLAGQLLTAFQDANLSPSSAEDTTAPSKQQTAASSTRSTSSRDRYTQQQQQQHPPQQQQQQQYPQQQHEQQYEHLRASVLGLGLDAVAAVRSRRRKSRSGSPESSVDGSGQLDQRQQQSLRHEHGTVHAPGSSTVGSVSSPGSPAKETAATDVGVCNNEEQDASDAADAVFLQLLLLLAHRAGFVPLSERDVQLAIALNTDFLWQLFVKANTEQLDSQFITNNLDIPGSSSSSSGGGGVRGTAAQLPEQTRSLLVLRRGYSSEKQRGRWLLQKLDYLQLLLVKRLLGGISSAGAAVWERVKPHQRVSRETQQQQQQQQQQQHRLDLQPATQERAELETGYQGMHPQQQLQQVREEASDVVQQQQQQQPSDQDQLTGIAAALAAVAGRQYTTTSNVGQQQRQGEGRRRRQKVQQRPRTDAFGRLYLYLEHERQNDAVDSEDSSSSSDQADSDVNKDSSNGTSSKSNQLNYQPGNATAGSHSSSSSKSSHSQLQQQQEQWRRQVRAHKQQVQQEGQRQQQRILSDLQSRIQERIMIIAHTLSDWGIIPRMDVIPLERFDEAFPLSEPQRLKPLYIEKATLPDIMDPVIEPRLQWLGTRAPSTNTQGANSSHTPQERLLNLHAGLTPADGISISSVDSHDMWDHATTPAAACGSSAGLFDALLQPVEVVEPTFRQLLVVYRKIPRRDRWRELKECITGNKTPTTATRRTPIQLQVYRDIPLPSWRVVFPDKLLQFRPLDLLRLDLFGLAGIGAALAQAKYTSVILQLLTLASLSVWIFRITLGYLRMGDRYKSIIAQLLAERTVSGGEGGLEYLATAAGLQQFKQAALVYVLLCGSERAMTADEVAEAAEKLLEDELQLQVCFNAQEALQELQRFGLLVAEQQQQPVHTMVAENSAKVAPEAAGAAAATVASRSIGVCSPADGNPQGHIMAVTATAAGVQQQQQQLLYRVLDSTAAQQVLQQYWARLLQQRVNSILSNV